jgi:hypothetical protein
MRQAGSRFTLLRAKPSKGGDAELRGYREATRHVRRAASDRQTSRRGGPVSFLGGTDVERENDVHFQAILSLGTH